MSASPPRIAIIGGGPAGLTTGLLLHNHNIPFTIFDLRQKPTDEELANPSGMLDLHDESGLAALQECGLLDEFHKLTGECSESQVVSDRNGQILYRDEGGARDRPEISRHNLTKLLISHIPANNIKWDHKLVSATSTIASGNTKIVLDFGPHGRQTCDLVIGADGAWSKVRNILTDVKPRYEGRQNITLTIRNVTKKYPHLAELVGTGSFSALADHHGVMSQRGPQDSARIYLMLTTDDEHLATTTGMGGKPATATAEVVLNDPLLLGNWGPTMKELVTIACKEDAADNPDGVEIRPLYTLPIGHGWEHKPGCTVIGDASHLMGPWAGEGVNLAMWDSLLLSHAIVKAQEHAQRDNVPIQEMLDPLIKEFEFDMQARAKEKAEESLENSQMLFGEDGAKAFVDFFHSVMPPLE